MQESTAKTVIFAVFKTMVFVISFLNASAGPAEKVWKATAKISFQPPHRDLERLSALQGTAANPHANGL